MLKIVSHNACWFQGFPYAGLDPDEPHPEVLDRLSSIYQSYDPHVLCVQEVQHAKMAGAIAGELGMNVQYSCGGEYHQYGCATYARDVEVLAEGRISSSPPQRAWQICRAVCGGAPLTIANVHLTSDRFLPETEAAAARLRDLVTMLDVALPSHEDGLDVICGDFNEGPRHDAAILLERRGYIDVAVATNASLPSTGVGKQRSDQIWVRDDLKSAITGFGAAAWESLAFESPGKNVLSDHLPLWVELRK